MRRLQLQDDTMTGPDVSDWQSFLQDQNTLTGNADGVFGLQTDTATRTYQTKARLTADGVVGVNTMAQALLNGYQSTTGRTSVAWIAARTPGRSPARLQPSE
jgi:peptidoglycan hydrolase-like protein with peptidoglycan-binding domain